MKAMFSLPEVHPLHGLTEEQWRQLDKMAVFADDPDLQKVVLILDCTEVFSRVFSSNFF
jgi:hypothetical protein